MSFFAENDLEEIRKLEKKVSGKKQDLVNHIHYELDKVFELLPYCKRSDEAKKDAKKALSILIKMFLNIEEAKK